MSKIKLHTYQQLVHCIAELEETKQKQENWLKNNLEKFYESFKLKNIIKKTIKDLAHDKEFKEDAYTFAIYSVVDFFVKKGFDKVVKYKDVIIPIVKKYKEKIPAFIRSLFSSNSSKTEPNSDL